MDNNNNIDEKDLYLLFAKLKKNNLIDTCKHLTNCVINYLKQEFIEKPTSDEILDVTASFFSNTNKDVVKLHDFLTLDEMTAVAYLIWSMIDTQLNNNNVEGTC